MANEVTHYLPKQNIHNHSCLTACGLASMSPGVNWDTDPDYVTCTKCIEVIVHNNPVETT